MKPQISTSRSSFSSFEHCEWTLTIGSDKLLVATIYRPPYSDKNKSTTNTFLDQFSTYMESIITSPLKLLIGGDFNFHVENKSSPDTTKFLDLLQHLNLTNHVWFPTHEKGHTLDLLITRSADTITLNQTKATNYLSDHTFIKSKLNLTKPPYETRNIQFRQLKKIDMEHLKADILKSDIHDINANISTTDKAERYDRTLRRLLDRHAPLLNKTIKIKNSSPWYNNELRTLKREKRKLERAWRKSRSDDDHQSFKSAR